MNKNACLAVILAVLSLILIICGTPFLNGSSSDTIFSSEDLTYVPYENGTGDAIDLQEWEARFQENIRHRLTETVNDLEKVESTDIVFSFNEKGQITGVSVSIHLVEGQLLSADEEKSIQAFISGAMKGVSEENVDLIA